MKISGSRRSARLGDQIMRELATMLAEKIQDPRLNMVTLSGVRMNTDLRVAEVLFTMGAGPASRDEVQAALAKAAGRLRSGLGRRLRLRYLPELRFVHDDFLEDTVYGRPDPGSGPDNQGQ
ncbi:MAG: 30S ribosome-binding factor RbfA [Desulfovibrionaceae bacterium]|nr:30S ribosome-binding factor RbfA [Desulfovibrionaceae bacterium]MDD4950978.1 30S ribosome-binding factor RbfA [Desulfovibrionaceae bacterium]